MGLITMLLLIIIIINGLHPPGDRSLLPTSFQDFWMDAPHPGTGATRTGMPPTRCWMKLETTLWFTTTGTGTITRAGRRLSWGWCIWGGMWQTIEIVSMVPEKRNICDYSAGEFQWSMWVSWWGRPPVTSGRTNSRTQEEEREGGGNGQVVLQVVSLVTPGGSPTGRQKYLLQQRLHICAPLLVDGSSLKIQFGHMTKGWRAPVRCSSIQSGRSNDRLISEQRESWADRYVGICGSQLTSSQRWRGCVSVLTHCALLSDGVLLSVV